MSFAIYPQPDACRAWMPTTPMPPGASPPSPPMVCHMPKGHDGQHSNERRPSTLSRRWDGDARPVREKRERESTPCPSELHIYGDDQWLGRPVARCVLDAPHEGKRHEGQDAGGSWFRW